MSPSIFFASGLHVLHVPALLDVPALDAELGLQRRHVAVASLFTHPVII